MNERREYAEDGVTYWYDSSANPCPSTSDLTPGDLAELGLGPKAVDSFGQCAIGRYVKHEVHVEPVSTYPSRFMCWRSGEQYSLTAAERCRADEQVQGAPDLGSDECRLPAGHEGPHPW